MKNLKSKESESYDEWWTPKREALVDALDLSGMRLDAIMAVLHGLKTEAMLQAMGEAWLDLHEKTGRFPTPSEIMMAMVCIRQTGRLSLTELEERLSR